MSIVIENRQEEFISSGGYFVVGATVVKCPLKDDPYYGTLLMTADLFDGSDSNVGTMQWRSLDGGRTFCEEGLMERSYRCDFTGSMIKSGYGGTFADDRTGAIVFFASDTWWNRGDYESIKRYRRMYYRLSYDSGRSWTDKRYIIQQGQDEKGRAYDGEHFLRDVVYGRNMAASVGSTALRGHDGSLLVGVQTQIVDEGGALVEPSGFMFLKCGALKGFWDPGKLDYRWELGEYAAVTPGESSRGVYEPFFARRTDGSILMVMRGSNMSFRDTIPGTKFYSVSRDEGLTWSAPQRLCYDDGTMMYSSSCIPKLLQHSNGKTYFIGVINDRNPDGNLPRYPLCIAQLDTHSCRVVKDTVTVIDTVRPHHAEQAGQTKNVVDYSNHTVYEDEGTGGIVVLAPYRPDLREYRSVLNKYIIRV